MWALLKCPVLSWGRLLSFGLRPMWELLLERPPSLGSEGNLQDFVLNLSFRCKHWFPTPCQAAAALQTLETGYLHLKTGFRTAGKSSRSTQHLAEFAWTDLLENNKEILLNWFLSYKGGRQMFPCYGWD